MRFKRPPRGLLLRLYERGLRRSERRAPPDLASLLRRAEGADVAWSAYIEAGSALVRAGRLDEADALYARAMAAFPDDRTLVVEHALSANAAGLTAEAVRRWRRAIAAAPDDPVCPFGLAVALRRSGLLEEATSVATAALERFPDDLALITEAAVISEVAGRFADGLAYWERLVARRNPHPLVLRGHVHCLLLLGRFEAAERAVRAALARYPDAMPLLAVEGILASSREDWPKAVALWGAYRRRFPDDGTGIDHFGRAVQGALLAEADARLASGTYEPTLVAPLELEQVEDDALRRLMLGFESIGNSCEFGSVQRRYGAEPLGLLRWNDVGFSNLLTALEHRFEGMGAPENTELPMLDNGEFTVRDRRWSLWMHTFLFAGQADPEQLFVKMCRRVAYLRDKLIDDLVAAEKIFVFRSTGLKAAELDLLHRALRTFGPVRLLSVQPSVSESGFAGPPGEVVEAAEDCLVGFISRLGVAEALTWDIAFEDWVSVCRKAAAWQHAH